MEAAQSSGVSGRAGGLRYSCHSPESCMLGILFACGSCRTNDPRQNYEVWSLGCQWTLLGSCGSHRGPKMHAPAHKITWFVTAYVQM